MHWQLMHIYMHVNFQQFINLIFLYQTDNMNKITILITGLLASFCFGFAARSIIVKPINSNTIKMKKVTGIGGIFFKCKDPKAVNEWYKTHLGFDTSPYGTSFEWWQIDPAPGGAKKGLTQWNTFA